MSADALPRASVRLVGELTLSPASSLRLFQQSPDFLRARQLRKSRTRCDGTLRDRRRAQGATAKHGRALDRYGGKRLQVRLDPQLCTLRSHGHYGCRNGSYQKFSLYALFLDS